MASKHCQKAFGGWVYTPKDRKPSSWRNINGAAVAAPSISLIGSFNFHVPLFLLNDEKRMVIAMIDHDMI